MMLVWKLLRQNISVSQFIGFALANIVGLFIVLLSIQFYNDTKVIFTGDGGVLKDEYMVLRKKVTPISTITGNTNSFSNDEIQNLEEQDFIEDIGFFTSSNFNVQASINIKGVQSFSTQMFFESVPDKFVDVKSDEWLFSDSHKIIPIVLPQNYLDLYNFGFAQSRNLPKLSESLIGMMNLQVEISGNGIKDLYRGKIVGFSSKINTILVPETFINWANHYYSNTTEDAPTRLIIQVNNPTDERILDFFNDRDYVTDEAKLDASKSTFVLKILSSIVGSFGFVICLLALYILLLSVYLLIEKNNDKLQNLILIGYSVSSISMPYQFIATFLNVLALICSIPLVLIVRSIYIELFIKLFPNYSPSTIVPTLITGLCVVAISSIVNIMVVRRKVSSLCIH